MDFYTAVSKRRTFYGISKETTTTNEKIKEIIEYTLKHVPSAFNSQSARVILLLGVHHNRLWDITREALKKVTPVEQFISTTENKIKGFQNGYGTILFFEDRSVVENFQSQYPLYKGIFPEWSLQSSGMHQFVIWTSLEIEGYGASLQHYNELIESEVKHEWHIPESWKIIAQMPFGKPVVKPDEKHMQPLENRFKVYE